MKIKNCCVQAEYGSFLFRLQIEAGLQFCNHFKSFKA